MVHGVMLVLQQPNIQVIIYLYKSYEPHNSHSIALSTGWAKLYGATYLNE